MKSIPVFLFLLLQHLVPHHGLSRLAGMFASSKVRPLKNNLIKLFIKAFDVDMSQAERTTPEEFASFNDFFTRELSEGAREVDSDPGSIVSPVDGEISQIGELDGDRVIQAKGKSYSLAALLGGDWHRSKVFEGGSFTTIYLSPRDYHRVHMPFKGSLKEMVHVPGRLFSVNQATTEGVEGLFARNERMVAIYDTDIGPMAVVMVGAMIVASIETPWAGVVTPVKSLPRSIRYGATKGRPVILDKGEEMGRFLLGSTAIVVFPKGVCQWQDQFQAGDKVEMGQRLGVCIE